MPKGKNELIILKNIYRKIIEPEFGGITKIHFILLNHYYIDYHYINYPIQQSLRTIKRYYCIFMPCIL